MESTFPPPGATETPRETPSPGFWQRFWGMIRHPAATLDGLTDRDAWFWPAIMLVIGYTVFHLAYGWGAGRWQELLTQQMLGTMPRPQPGQPNAAVWLDMWFRGMVLFQVASQVVAVPMLVASSWAVRCALFYGLARLLGGAPVAMGRLAATVGWCWVPLFLQYVLFGVAMMVSPAVMGFLLPLPADLEKFEMASTMQNSWKGLVIYVTPFVAWNLVLCGMGVARLFRLVWWKAAIVVLTPGVLHLLFQGVGLLLSLASLNSMPKLPPPSGPNGPAP